MLVSDSVIYPVLTVCVPCVVSFFVFVCYCLLLIIACESVTAVTSCFHTFFSAYHCAIASHVQDVCCVVSFVVPILETVAAHCAVPPPGYLCDVDGDGHVLAGVEIEIPGDGVLVMPQKKFFWSSGCQGSADAFEQAALQAIKFLQGLYGFIVRDYNYECVVVYRNSANAAVAVAASAVRYATYLERTLACTRSSSPNPAINVFRGQPQPPPNLALLYSRLLASLCCI